MDKLSSFIDHTLLKAEAGESRYRQLCEEAVEWNFYSVCVPPNRIRFAKDYLKGHPVKVCTVVGFPWGYSLADSKVGEAKDVCRLGVDEIDMVMGVNQLKDGGNEKAIVDEIKRVKSLGPTLKVIIESSLLSKTEISLASKLCVDGGADFVKTSTGFAGGATAEAVSTIREAIGTSIQIKASGGIATYRDALNYIELGVHRLGTSKSRKIMEESKVGPLSTAPKLEN